MLCSIPWNKNEDLPIKLNNELLCLNEKFNQALSLHDFLAIQDTLTKIYKELFCLQTSLVKEKGIIDNSEYAQYQKYLDHTFRKYFFVEKKLIAAKSSITAMAKNGTISSTNDAILFSNDDLLV